MELAAEDPILAEGLREVKAAVVFGRLPRPGGFSSQSEVFVDLASRLMDLGLLDASRSVLQMGEAHLKHLLAGIAAMFGG